ncbi:S41 family peptidase [Lignipirellula cremea]|uniref:Putative CtpA-like serine protease n=1 Tax=Lignipirellula cremea TaxID=2528010 RepID=A0A518DWY1_9BACT|nr:S41 family peptidase [Lignipirellula cremea]QDU96346.1 putative CtpA-like serine protease [Lignipirellula cremea]
MQSRQTRYGALTVASAFVAYLVPMTLFAPVAHSQVRVPAAALVDQAELQRVLQEGADLERNRHWSDALHHYEKGLKAFPGQRSIEERLTLSRVHWDIVRRSHDSSYVGSVNAMSELQSLDLYAEVLLKVHAHYVTTPDWRAVAQRGALFLEVALDEPGFTDRYLPSVTPEQKRAFIAELRRTMAMRVVRSRYEARDAAAAIAHLAAARLGLASSATVCEFTCGALGSLDQYTSFLTAAQLDEVFSQIEGNFVGLGVELKAEDHALLIVNVIKGGPADAAGIKSGDRITEVDRKSMYDITTDQAADMLRGTEGSSVDLLVVGPEARERQVQVRRARVEVPSVEGVQLIDPDYGVGYMRISSFQKTTVADADAALWDLHRQGMRSLIIDVRGNPGGLLTASVELADKFLEKGVIVSTRGRSSQEDFDYQAHAAGTWRMPLVVLIDGDSASASEIFAGAIHDHHRGQVVGETSYGKGSVQGIFPLTGAKSGVRLTTAKFFSPSGQAISDRGVTPDMVVRTVAKPEAVAGGTIAESKEDRVLQAGVQVARQQISQRQ